MRSAAMAGAEPEVIEARRGVLQVRREALLPKIAGVLAPFPHNIDHELVYMPTESIRGAVCALRDAGISATSLEMEIDALQEPPSKGTPARDFGYYLIPDSLGITPDKAEWKRYSFSSRRMLSAKAKQVQREQWALFLRKGQPVIAFDSGQRRGFYAPDAQAQVLASCKDPQALLAACHRQSLPASVYYEAKPSLAPFAAVYNSPIWLPPQHYRLLYERLIGDKPKGRGLKDFVLIYLSDLPLARKILASLGIELVEGVPPERSNQRALQIIEIASRAVEQAYAVYLKSEVGVANLEAIGQERGWERVEDPEFQQTLVDLSNRAYEFEPLSDELLAYLVDRLPRSLDWKALRGSGAGDSMIEGVALTADNSLTERHSHRGYSRYIKVVVQQLNLVLGVVTKREIMAGRSEGQAEYFVASRWRATPYAGRLKFTGDASSLLSERASGKQAAEEGYTFICGIPSIEARLARDLYLSAFFLDRDSKYWRGQNELSRYFAGHGKLIEKMVADFDEPACLFEDVFGDYFFLKFGQANYARHEEFIQGTDVGTWKRFVAHSGLQSLLRSESGLPAFDLSHGSVPRAAGHLEVAEATMLGILRYYGRIAEPEFIQMLSQSRVRPHLVDPALSNLERRGRIVRDSGMLYYGYSFCSAEERPKLGDAEQLLNVGADARAYYVGLRPFLPIMHPLGYGGSLAAQGPMAERRQRQVKRIRREDQFALFVTRGRADDALNRALKNLKEEGIAVLRAHPWNVEHACAIISSLRLALSDADLEVHRRDMPTTYKGRVVQEAWLRIFCRDILERRYFVGQLRHRWGLAAPAPKRATKRG